MYIFAGGRNRATKVRETSRPVPGIPQGKFCDLESLAVVISCIFGGQFYRITMIIKRHIKDRKDSIFQDFEYILNFFHSQYFLILIIIKIILKDSRDF